MDSWCLSTNLRHQLPKLPTRENLNTSENQAPPVGTCLTTSKTPTQFLPHSPSCSPDKPSAPSEPLLPSVLLLSERCPCGLLPLLPPTMASPPLLCLALTAPMPLLWYVYYHIIRRLAGFPSMFGIQLGRRNCRTGETSESETVPDDEGIYCRITPFAETLTACASINSTPPPPSHRRSIPPPRASLTSAPFSKRTRSSVPSCPLPR